MLPNDIRLQRQGRGLSQIDLGRRAGLSQATISAVERGDVAPTPRTMHALAAAFGVAPSVLRDRKDLRREAAKRPEQIVLIIRDATRAIELFDGVLADEPALDDDQRASLVAARDGAALLRDAALALTGGSAQ